MRNNSMVSHCACLWLSRRKWELSISDSDLQEGRIIALTSKIIHFCTIEIMFVAMEQIV